MLPCEMRTIVNVDHELGQVGHLVGPLSVMDCRWP